MTIFALRIFLFTILPLFLAGGQIWLDKSTNTRARRFEIILIYLFALGVAGSGIGGFIAHFFMSDVVAESIGWPAGSPFQLEIAFANLAVGLLGILSVNRRDGAREATVIAVTTFSLGATIVHFMDIAATGNLAPGNSLQNVINILRPALLIIFLRASRRADRAPGSEAGTLEFAIWRAPRTQAAGNATAIVATGFGAGFAIGQPVLGSALGVIAAVIVIVFILSRAPSDPAIASLHSDRQDASL
jgi:hypothetical protein